MSITELSVAAYKILRTEGATALMQKVPPFLLNKLPSENRFHTLTKYRYIKNNIKYDHYPNPYQTINVDINNISKGIRLSKSKGLGRIVGGDWEHEYKLFPVEDHHTVKGLKQRFEEGNDWEDTIYYKRAKKKYEDDKLEYSSMDKFKQIRCGFVDDLYNHIKYNGYKAENSQRITLPDKHNKKGHWTINLEPMVAIGEDGEIFWRDGWHRFALANILNVNQIPVHVLARHEKWLQTRSDLKKGLQNEKSTSEIISHPDL